MRGSRLNGWQRIGIVLSVLWIPVGHVWALKTLQPDRLPDWPYSALCQDAETRKPNPNYERCIDDAQKWYEGQDKLRKLDFEDAERLAPWFALAPIPVAWFTIYVFVWLGRWIRRGFQLAR